MWASEVKTADRVAVTSSCCVVLAAACCRGNCCVQLGCKAQSLSWLAMWNHWAVCFLSRKVPAGTTLRTRCDCAQNNMWQVTSGKGQKEKRALNVTCKLNLSDGTFSTWITLEALHLTYSSFMMVRKCFCKAGKWVSIFNQETWNADF